MYYVYLLKSLVKKWYYIGLTDNTIRRLQQHNKGSVKSTKYYKPFSLIYKMEFPDRIKARDYEKYLKVRSNKEKILKDLGYLI